MENLKALVAFNMGDKRDSLATTSFEELKALLPIDKPIKVGEKYTSKDGHSLTIEGIELTINEMTNDNKTGIMHGRNPETATPFNIVITISGKQV